MQVRSVVSAMTALLLLLSLDQVDANPSAPTTGADICRPPASNWRPQGSESSELQWYNALEAAPDRLLWNDTPISDKELAKRLSQASRHPFGGMVLIIAPSLPCDQVIALRSAISRKMKCGRERICVEYSANEWQATRPPTQPATKK